MPIPAAEIRALLAASGEKIGEDLDEHGGKDVDDVVECPHCPSPGGGCAYCDGRGAVTPARRAAYERLTRETRR